MWSRARAEGWGASSRCTSRSSAPACSRSTSAKSCCERRPRPPRRSHSRWLRAVADVSSSQQTGALGDAARRALGGLDALVNNAAIVEGLRRRGFDEIDEDEWDRVLAVNVKGTWLCARALVGLMREAGGGSIVNMASEVAFSGSPGLAHYVASKAAVVGLTRTLARELGPSQIRVNAIAPGFIPTQASQGMLAEAHYDTSGTPLGRVGQPADLLGALAFLVSDESSFVTGQTLLVNGGRLVR